MSYALMPYAVDLGVLRSVVGSQSDEALQLARHGFERAAERIQSVILEQWTEPHPPSADDVLRQLIDGSHQDARLGSAYAYALEHLCDRYGQFLDNRAWSPVSWSFFDAVQAALAFAGVRGEELSVHSLVSGGAPISLELLDDYPAVGFWEKPVLARAAAVLAKLNAEALPADVRDALRALEDWVLYCAPAGRALVCFCY